MSRAASGTIVATFPTRRQADLVVEKLVQDLGIERTDVFVMADSRDISSGREAAVADAESGHPGVDAGAARHRSPVPRVFRWIFQTKPTS